MTFLIGKLKEYLLHFAVSCLIILGILGIVKYHNDVRNLNEQIYLQSKAHNSLVISKPAPRSIIEKILDKKILPVSPDIPKNDISKVIEVKTSSNCPNVDVTVLKDGTVVSNSSGVTHILVEDYEHPLYYNKLDLRLAGIFYPKTKSHNWDWDLGLQISYWHFWRLTPDLTVAPDFVGGGISYNPNIKHLENLDVGIGYGYRFDWGEALPYAAGSLRFGK